MTNHSQRNLRAFAAFARRALLTSAAASLIAITVGCSASGPLNAWTRQVESSVRQNGKLDFGQLYRYADDSPQQRSGMITVRTLDEPGGGIWPFITHFDTVGVLIGTDQSRNTMSYAFLTGLVKLDSGRIGRDRAEHELRDIRFAVAQPDGNKLRWFISEENEAALQQYDAYRSNPDAGLTLYPFPNSADRYQLMRENGVMTCVEERSGARWSVTVKD